MRRDEASERTKKEPAEEEGRRERASSSRARATKDVAGSTYSLRAAASPPPWGSLSGGREHWSSLPSEWGSVRSMRRCSPSMRPSTVSQAGASSERRPRAVCITCRQLRKWPHVDCRFSWIVCRWACTARCSCSECLLITLRKDEERAATRVSRSARSVSALARIPSMDLPSRSMASALKSFSCRCDDGKVSATTDTPTATGKTTTR
mmetsp:Transcript_44623/g.144960  ORF Transcript_44623/g.144960 Transcript_44623/m.144960 type:complete len:207 (+) Transcript_44623:965-1585(+)